MDRENLSEIQSKTVLLVYGYRAKLRCWLCRRMWKQAASIYNWKIDGHNWAHRSNRTTYAWVLNCILATSGACSTKVLLDSLRVFFEYAKIEQMEERLCCQGSSGWKFSTCWPREDLLFHHLKNLPNFSFLLTKERDEKSKIDCLGSPQIFSEGSGRLNTGYYLHEFFWCLCVSLSSLLYVPAVWKMS